MRCPHQKCARCSHVITQIFRWNHTIIVSLSRRYLVAFSCPDYSKLNTNWYTYTNPRPGQYLTHAQNHITLALADICHDQGRPHRNILKIMYYFFRVHNLFLRSDLGAAILEGVKKGQENDLRSKTKFSKKFVQHQNRSKMMSTNMWSSGPSCSKAD